MILNLIKPYFTIDWYFNVNFRFNDTSFYIKCYKYENNQTIIILICIALITFKLILL